MRDRSSSTIFGVRCRRRLRWCRELRWASIFSARGAAEAPAATIRANSKKKSYLFELNNRDSILDGDRHSCLSLFIVRRACSAAGGCKSRPNLMEVKGSEAQGRHCEVRSEGSVEQRCGPMDKNWI